MIIIIIIMIIIIIKIITMIIIVTIIIEITIIISNLILDILILNRDIFRVPLLAFFKQDRHSLGVCREPL